MKTVWRGCSARPRGVLGLPAATLAALVLFAASGCSADRPAPHELRIALSIDPASLSPLLAFAQNQIATDLLFCQTLVGLDANDRVIPVLAVRVPSRANGGISPDGRRITYHLRTDARFADGVPLTSADVAFTYRAIFDPRNNAASVDAYRRIASLTTPDPHTVVVTLRQPWNAAPNVLFAQADFAYGILPKHAFADTMVSGSAWDRMPFGSGPFRVQSWTRGGDIVLVPNPYFRPAPKLARITLRIIPNPTSALFALRTHGVDVATLSPQNLAQAEALPGIRIARIAENGLGAINFQTQRAPTDDVRVRRALAEALDLPAMTRIWRDAYPLASGFLPAPVVRWRAAPLPGYRFDPAQAARDLDAAGWHLRGGVRLKDGSPMNLLYVVNADDQLQAPLALVVQSQLARIGVRTTLKAFPSSLFSAPNGPLRSGRFALALGDFIGGSDPEQSVNFLCAQARNGGESYSRYCSPRFEAIFHDQMFTRSEIGRQRDFDALRRQIRDDVPVIPLYDEIYLEGVDARVTGYRRNMLRFPVAPEAWDVR